MSPAEIVARAIEPQAWAAAGVGDTLAYRNRRVSSERKAHRILAALEAAGYVIAPTEPTPEMRDSAGQMAADLNPGRTEHHIKSVALDSLTIYRAMIAARPKP